ncbi:MAG: DivIVA domain-containing protein [Desulfitobacteriaceae bacterium]
MNTEFPNFKRVVRGYDPEAVETAWAEMERYIAEVNATNKELRLQINSLREQNTEWRNRLKDYEQIEKDLRDAMISAQRIAGQVKGDAERQAEELLTSARIQADSILSESQLQSEQRIQELDDQLNNKQAEITRIDNILAALTVEREQLQERVDQVKRLIESAENILGEH